MPQQTPVQPFDHDLFEHGWLKFDPQDDPPASIDPFPDTWVDTSRFDNDMFDRGWEREEQKQRYDLPEEEEPKSYWEKGLEHFAFDRNIDRSVYYTLLQNDPEAVKRIDKSLGKKTKTGNMLRQTLARTASSVPVVGPNFAEKALNLSEVDFNALELERIKDPLSPYYDAAIRGVDIGHGQQIGLRDVSDLMLTLARFKGIGAGTRFIAQKLPFGRNGKFMRLMTATEWKKRTAARALKAAVDFNIDAYSTLYPELTKEGVPLEDKINAMVQTFPKATISGTLFGVLGGARGVMKQYGGIFTAGYASALVQGTGHKEAFKSGTLLTAMHGANVLGAKGGAKAFQRWGKEQNISEADLKQYTDMIVEKKYDQTQPVWRTGKPEQMGIAPRGDGYGSVQMVKGPKGKGAKRVVVVRDLETDDNVKINAGQFYKEFEVRRNPSESGKIRKDKLGRIHSKMNELEITNTEEEQAFKRKTLGEIEEPIEERKEGELPYYLYLKRSTVKGLKDVGEKYGIDPSEFKDMERADMIEHINERIPRQPGKRLSWADASDEQLYKADIELRKRATHKRVKEDLEEGVYSPDMEGSGMLGRTDDPRIIYSVQNIVQTKLAHDNIAAFEGNTHRAKFETLIKKNKISSNRYATIMNARFSKKDYDSLSSKELELLDKWEDHWEVGLEFGRQAGIIDNAVDNYWPGVFEGKPKANQQKIENYIKLNPESQFAKEKRYVSPEMAEEAGLKPVYDIPVLVEKWWRSVGEAKSAKEFIDRVKDLPTTHEGHPVVSSNFVEGYKSSNNPQLLRNILGKSYGKVWMHPEIYEDFQHLMSPPEAGPIKSVYIKARGNLKRIVMINPLIHGWNIYSDTFNEMWMRHWDSVLPPFYKTARMIGFLAPRYSEAKREQFFKKWGFDGTTEDMRRVMAGDGRVNMDVAGARGVELEDYQKGHMRDLAANPLTKIARHPIKEIKWMSDKYLWGRIVQSAQEVIFAIKYGTFIKDGHTPKRAAAMAGSQTNTLLGTIGPEVFTPTNASYLNAMFFARNWTISNVRIVSGAMGVTDPKIPAIPYILPKKVHGQPVARFLAHKGFTPEEMKSHQKEYAKHLVKSVVGLFTITNALNYIFTGTEGLTKKLDKKKAKYAFENPEGHRWDVDLGTTDKEGNRIYTVQPTYRYTRDYLGWASDPLKTFFNKMEPMLKMGLEQLFDYSVWASKNIEHPGATFAENAKRRLRYAFDGLTPAGQYFDRPGEVRNWYERLAPLVGTWIRHGTVGDQLGQRINEFQNLKRYKREQLDIELDEMLQNAREGDYTETIAKMVKERRYTSIRGIANRLSKYKNPFWYKYKTLLNSPQLQLEFRTWLCAEHPEDCRMYKDYVRKGMQ
jgi:hypothetical protein|tara:strand:+ start:19 stop:4116 length:4098 start_codon:yes stop_codon:yes gene_type:complete